MLLSRTFAQILLPNFGPSLIRSAVAKTIIGCSAPRSVIAMAISSHTPKCRPCKNNSYRCLWAEGLLSHLYQQTVKMHCKADNTLHPKCSLWHNVFHDLPSLFIVLCQMTELVVQYCMCGAFQCQNVRNTAGDLLYSAIHVVSDSNKKLSHCRDSMWCRWWWLYIQQSHSPSTVSKNANKYHSNSPSITLSGIPMHAQ